MIIDNKLDLSYGPTFSASGYVLIIAGIVNGFLGGILVGMLITLLGAFAAFSYNGTLLNTEKKQYMKYSMLFGVFRIGRWENITTSHILMMGQAKKSPTAFSRSNRPRTNTKADYRIFLFDRVTKKRVDVKIVDSVRKGEDEVKKYGELLGVPYQE